MLEWSILLCVGSMKRGMVGLMSQIMVNCKGVMYGVLE